MRTLFIFFTIFISCQNGKIDKKLAAENSIKEQQVKVKKQDEGAKISIDTMHSKGKKQEINRINSTLEAVEPKINKTKERKENSKQQSLVKESSMRAKTLHEEEYDKKNKIWNNFYSKDTTWNSLYKKTEESFLKGWDRELTINEASIEKLDKSFLIAVFGKRMEKTFFQTPSFIQFSVNSFSSGPAFENFLAKWKIPN